MFHNSDQNPSKNACYFLVDISTCFHCGEAIVKSDKTNDSWRCMFTLCNSYIDVICNVPIERTAITRIIRVVDIYRLDEFMVSNNALQERFTTTETKQVTDASLSNQSIQPSGKCS